MEKIKLFCIPYAGGSAGIYSKWNGHISKFIEVCPVELPGRGKRFSEPLCNSIKQMVDDVFKGIRVCIATQPYAIFGYSMGSLIAYEVIRKVERYGYPSPLHAFFAAKQAPHMNREKKNFHLLEQKAFLAEIMKLGGTPKELLENEELVNIAVEILRADYQAVETYDHNKINNKINCNVSVFYGEEDSYPYECIQEWASLTRRDSRFFGFSGGHFFIHQYLCEVIDIVNIALENAIGLDVSIPI
ncbi:MAG: thioesterase [Clostridiaceae bacterium]|jgi:surfactin synthase thioesterase subunit|nr:thioesterase [Clostridiaceae bacterium]